jgi:hypothetical protein
VIYKNSRWCSQFFCFQPIHNETKQMSRDDSSCQQTNASRGSAVISPAAPAASSTSSLDSTVGATFQFSFLLLPSPSELAARSPPPPPSLPLREQQLASERPPHRSPDPRRPFSRPSTAQSPAPFLPRFFVAALPRRSSFLFSGGGRKSSVLSDSSRPLPKVINHLVPIAFL